MNTIFKKDSFCYQCTLQFDNRSIYDLHLKLVHKQIFQTKSMKKEPKSIKSTKRGSKIVAKLGSNVQIVTVHHERKTFEFKVCNYTTSHEGNYDRHIASVHEGKKPKTCHLCDYTYLEKHLDSIHKRNKPFQCDFCSYTYSQEFSLKKHVASVHDGKKPFECDFCKNKFSQKSDLKRHVVSVHDGKKPFTYNSETADKILRKRNSTFSHFCRKFSVKNYKRKSAEITSICGWISNTDIICRICRQIICSARLLKTLEYLRI